ncbi:MAG: hypothetical protein WDN45_08260 [Caulobacteraceae bacterium]
MFDSRRPLLALLALAAASAATPALAWEDVGHRWIGTLGAQAPAAGPAGLPAHARGGARHRRMGPRAGPFARLGPHPRPGTPATSPTSTTDGKMLGGPTPDHMPVTRAEYEKQLQAAGTDGWKAGYLHYNIVEGWQQLVKDFAYWRADAYGEKTAKDPAHKAWLKDDRVRREKQLIFDLGYWAHFVGDGSQPLHATYHYNGLGQFPEPQGFTQRRSTGRSRASSSTTTSRSRG